MTRPDTPLAAAFEPSPNHGERKGGARPDMLLLHYTGMDTGAAALARLVDPDAQVSAHYVVFEDGRILQLVPEVRRAWHAGAGCWAGERDVNSRSIGVEIVHPGHQGGLPPYPPEQVEAVIRLGLDVSRRWAIPAERVLGHSDTAPGRKEDPGEVFPWDRLHRAGLGRWVPPSPLASGPALEPGDAGPAVSALQAALARYGYDLADTGVYDEGTAAVVSAFQRHFRPALVDGVADPSTTATLRALLDGLPAARDPDAASSSTGEAPMRPITASSAGSRSGASSRDRAP